MEDTFKCIGIMPGRKTDAAPVAYVGASGEVAAAKKINEKDVGVEVTESDKEIRIAPLHILLNHGQYTLGDYPQYDKLINDAVAAQGL